MSADDRFLLQGKQILRKIWQVRPMPYSSFSQNSSSCTKNMVTAVLGASPHYCYCLDMHRSSSTST